MIKLRILIVKDPDAHARGFSLKGCRVPLTTFCPVRSDQALIGFDKSKAHGLYSEYWEIPTELLIKCKPELHRHLRSLDILLVPTDWCDLSPAEFDLPYMELFK